MTAFSRLGPRPLPAPWLLALGATLLVQSVASFMGQCLPVVAPLLTASAHVDPAAIGALSSLTSFGTVLFLAFGSPLLARFGPVRTLQAGLLMAVASIAVVATGWWPGMIAAAVGLGIGYGPTPPAGSRILAATAPPRHRTLIFSIKQAGAPAGGALAGLLLAPLAATAGWAPALLVACAVGLASALIIAPLREMMDSERDAGRSLHIRALLHPASLLAPIAALRDRRVATMTALAVSFSLVQGTLFSFSVTYLTQRGLDLPLAGAAYASLQAAGVIARILLGWLADRTGRPAVNLIAQAFVAAACVEIFAYMPAGAPYPIVVAVCTAAGFFCASWNGIYMAEIARLAPPENVADATSGSTLFTFLGYVAGPAAFSLAIPFIGWSAPFAVAGIQLAIVAFVLSLQRL